MAVKSYQLSVECGYKTLAEKMDNVSELAHMSLNIDIKQLDDGDDGDGNEATFMRHHAGWHKTYSNRTIAEENNSSLFYTHIPIIVL